MKKIILFLCFILAAAAANAQIRINEIDPINENSIADENGDYSDWIELYNPGTAPVGLTGWKLSDGNTPKWTLPNVSIPAGGRQLVFCSGKNRTAPNLHTNFALDLNEKVVLWNTTNIIQDSITIGSVQAGNVRSRIPDGGVWCHATVRTPNAANSGTCYLGYAATPTLALAAGFYTSAQSVGVIIPTNTTVRYTTDGNYPSATAMLYTTPIAIAASKVIKIQAFEAGKLPSAVAVGSYFIAQNTTLPVVSISAPHRDLFNDGTGGQAVYDDAPYGGGLDPILAHLEYFDASKIRRLNIPTGFAVAGNYSTTFDQKGVQFTNKSEFNSPDDMNYRIFEVDKPNINKYHAFRLRNTDDDYSEARMRDVIVNRAALKTNAIAAGYQNVAAYINGQYWGHYTARERLDKYFLRDNFGYHTDSVEIIKTSMGSYTAESGNMTNYNALVNFITNNNMANAANYAQAINKIDVENWVDYLATQIYFANTDWIPEYHNNIRCFRNIENGGGKWKYMLWDCALSQDNAGNVQMTRNTLQNVMTNPMNTDLGKMFNALRTNPTFKNYFVNRFADLMNYHYTTPKIHAIIDANTAELYPEIQAQYNRWGNGNPGSQAPADFMNQVNTIKNFHTGRIANQRNHIRSSMGLVAQVNVTLQATPAGAGYIKISTIVPDALPWTGVYFNGVPVTVTAIANPGFTFVNWNANAFISNLTNPIFTNNFTTNTTFTANFSGVAIANPIIITEINYNSDSTRTAGDWLELHNNSATPLNISDYTLQDENFYNKFIIPTGTIIAPNGYMIIAEDLVKFNTIYPNITNVVGGWAFGLSNGGEKISIFNKFEILIDSIRYDDALTTWWAQCADGYGRTLERQIPFANPNLPTSWFNGCVLGSPAAAYAPCTEAIVFNEINYKSSIAADASDWIELHNRSTSAVDISGFVVADDKVGNAYTIPAGTVIPAGGYLVIYSDLAKFNAINPNITNKIGAFSFGLGAGGEYLRLYDPLGKIYTSMFFHSISPWATTPNGTGYTLSLTNAANEPNRSTSWQPSVVAGGTPGANNADLAPVLAIKMLLGGGYVSSTALMNDNLRAGNYIPLTEPYTAAGLACTGEATTTAAVLGVVGNNAIVDWVIVELRTTNTATASIIRKAALLQRDGDVVNVDGVSPIKFSTTPAGNYYVAVRHRNHLGVMTLGAMPLNNTPTQIDFSSSLINVHGTNAQQTLSNGRRVLWAGNASNDNKIVYSGAGTDINGISSAVFSNPLNTPPQANIPLSGYHRADVNMDGKVVYVGTRTDVNVVSSSVFSNSANTGALANIPILQQLP